MFITISLNTNKLMLLMLSPACRHLALCLVLRRPRRDEADGGATRLLGRYRGDIGEIKGDEEDGGATRVRSVRAVSSES